MPFVYQKNRGLNISVVDKVGMRPFVLAPSELFSELASLVWGSLPLLPVGAPHPWCYRAPPLVIQALCLSSPPSCARHQ